MPCRRDALLVTKRVVRMTQTKGRFDKPVDEAMTMGLSYEAATTGQTGSNKIGNTNIKQ